MTQRHWTLALAAALSFAPAVVRAEAINPATTPQTAPMNGQEKKNLDIVMNWWREVVYAGHFDLAPKYQAETYIQHNPTVDTGRAAWIAFFQKRVPQPMNPIPATMPRMPVVMGAKGDYVWLIWESEDKDPRDPSKTYHHNSFDVLRIEKGKVQEHWDSAQRNANSPTVTYGVSRKPPSHWNLGKLSAEEKKTTELATEELKDMLQYGHLELADKTMDPGYIQHNPNVPQGRDGFKAFMSRVPGRVPEEIKPEWKNPPVLMLVNGPYAFMMWDRKAKDPVNPSKEYTWNHFDVVRMESGKIKEHWDEAVINAPQAGKK